jgi:hypothetical protein
MLLAPFALLAVLAAGGASDDSMSAGFLSAAFVCYLLLPSRRHLRQELDRG